MNLEQERQYSYKITLWRVCGYPNNLISFHSKSSFLWRFNIASKNETYLSPYLGLFFLDPEVLRSLSLGAIWNLSKEQGSYDTDIRLWGTKAC